MPFTAPSTSGPPSFAGMRAMLTCDRLDQSGQARGRVDGEAGHASKVCDVVARCSGRRNSLLQPVTSSIDPPFITRNPVGII